MIEMLWDEQPSTGRGKNVTSGIAGSNFLEKASALYQPMHIWVTGTQMHMLFRITETDRHTMHTSEKRENAHTTGQTTQIHSHTNSEECWTERISKMFIKLSCFKDMTSCLLPRWPRRYLNFPLDNQSLPYFLHSHKQRYLFCTQFTVQMSKLDLSQLMN